MHTGAAIMETAWRYIFQKIKKTGLPYDPEFPLLVIYLKKSTSWTWLMKCSSSHPYQCGHGIIQQSTRLQVWSPGGESARGKLINVSLPPFPSLQPTYLPPHPCLSPWNVHSAYYSHSGSCSQECSLERARCCWDHLDGTSDWAQLRPPCKLLRFWQWCRDLLIL